MVGTKVVVGATVVDNTVVSTSFLVVFSSLSFFDFAVGFPNVISTSLLESFWLLRWKFAGRVMSLPGTSALASW